MWNSIKKAFLLRVGISVWAFIVGHGDDIKVWMFWEGYKNLAHRPFNITLLSNAK